MLEDDDVASALERSRDLIKRAELPDDLRQAAFERVFEALLAGASNGAASPTGELGSRKTSPGLGGGDSLMATVAKRLDVPEERLARVVEIDAEGVHLVAPRSKFAKTKAAAHDQIALLVAATSSIAGYHQDGWVSQSTVRAATEELGVDDPSNFAAYLRRVDGVRLRGSGRTGELKINAVGMERASALINELGAGES